MMAQRTWRETNQALFILNRRPYRESSLLIDAFSEQHGKLSLIAKGARGPRSKTSGLLQPFVSLRAGWQGKSDLLTLTTVERASPSQRDLIGKPMFCGFYMNELLSHFLHRLDPHPTLFARYVEAIDLLSESDPEMDLILRQFEIQLLQETGFGLVLDQEGDSAGPVHPQKLYRFHPEQGALSKERAPSDGVELHGQTLINLSANQAGTKAERREAKHLMRFLIDYHLNGKLLKSRDLFG